jgi:hypothetical protein
MGQTFRETTVSTPRSDSIGFMLHFDSLFHEGRGLAFPCDARGHVDLDKLPDRARDNYLYARAVIGREYAQPAVRAALLH